MAATKRHGEGNGSTDWLPSVSNEKHLKNRNDSATNANTTIIQLGKGEIHSMNQSNSPGPSSIKMYQQQAG